MKRIITFLMITVTTMLSPLARHTYLSHPKHHDLRTGLLSFPLTPSPQHTSSLLNSSLQVSGFYEQIWHSRTVGALLSNAPSTATYNFVRIGTSASVTAGTADAVNNYFVHNDPAVANTLSTQLSIAPSYHCYGALFTYDQYVPLFSGFHLGAQLPLVDCRTNIHLIEENKTQNSTGELLNYFAGTYSSDTAKRAQTALLYVKFDVYEHQLGGASHLDLWMRKRLFSLPRLTLDGRMLLTVPLISPTSGHYLMPSTIGSNGHWIVGADLAAKTLLWGSEENRLMLHARVHGHYVAGTKEKRVIPLLSTRDQSPFGHYALFTNKNSSANDTLVPAANLLAKNISITPGFQYETTGLIEYRHNSVSFLGGYTYAHHTKESLGSFKWTDDTYAIAGSAYDTTQTFAAQELTANALVPITTNSGASHTYVQKADLDKTKAEQLERTLHTFWFQASHHIKIYTGTVSAQVGFAGTVSSSSFHGYPLSVWGSLSLQV